MTAITVTVKQVLEQKGSVTYSVTPDTSVFDALAMMALHDIGAVLVTDTGKLVGIFTERDYARKIVLKGLSSRDVKVGEMMTTNVQTIKPSDQIISVMNTMTNKRFRHLPVLDADANLAGIVTIGDVVKAVIQEQEATIQHLANYIAGDIAT
ncbi:CBS domain-containing protein [Rhodocyclaceae bacterium SMB388]